MTTEATEPTREELQRFAQSFGYEGDPAVRKHYERHRAREREREEPSSEPEVAVAVVQDAASRVRALQEAWQRLQPLVAVGDAEAKAELRSVESELRAAKTALDRERAEHEVAKKARAEQRAKAREEATGLAAQIEADAPKVDRALVAAAKAVAAHVALHDQREVALRTLGGPPSAWSVARLPPSRINEAWHRALLSAGLHPSLARSLYGAGEGQPFTQTDRR